MRLTIIAASLAAACLSSGFAPAFAGDDPGMRSELGIDITDAGNTHAEVKRFLAGLEPDTRRAVLDGCRYYLEQPVMAQQATTIPFCKLAL